MKTIRKIANKLGLSEEETLEALKSLLRRELQLKYQSQALVVNLDPEGNFQGLDVRHHADCHYLGEDIREGDTVIRIVNDYAGSSLVELFDLLIEKQSQ